MVKFLALFTNQFQIDTRSQRHLVRTGSVIAISSVVLSFFPSIIRLSIGLIVWIATIGYTYIVELHIAGQITQVVHLAIDTEVVAVLAVGIIPRSALIERQFSHTVQGVTSIVHLLRHTVAGSLQHNTAAEDSCHITTLNRVQQTTSIEGTESHFIKISQIGRTISIDISLETDGIILFIVKIVTKFLFELIRTQPIVSINRNSCRLSVQCTRHRNRSFCFIVQYKVSTLAVTHTVIGLLGDFFVSTVIVGAIVVDVYFAIAVHHRQVTIAIESARMFGTDGDKVTVVGIA